MSKNNMQKMNVKMNLKTKILIAIILLFGLSQSSQAVQIDEESSSISMDQILHFGSFPNEEMREALGKNNTTLRGNRNGLTILGGGFQKFQQDISDFSDETLNPDEDIAAATTTQALVYPNPFRQETGAKLGYGLSKDLDIDIQFYDMLAHRILEKSFKKGSIGGKKGYNLVDIDRNDFGTNVNLSSGVYFYLVLNEGKVLAKGKAAIVP
jgi:hypothetical protein